MANVSPEEAVRRILDKAADIIMEEMMNGLAYVGEECVKRIREQGRPGDWKDQTGNLRSSIGYTVYEHGKKMFGSAFEPVTGSGGTGTEGSEKGKKYVEELASKYADTYALVVVAGMDYAEYVETKRDVLASTELYAKGRIEQVLKVFKQRAEQRISALM